MIVKSLGREKLTVEVEGREEAMRVADIFGIEKGNDEWMDLVTGKNSVAERKAGQKHLDNGGGFVRVEISTDFIGPYLSRLEKTAGAVPFDMPLPSMVEAYHTHIVESAKIVGGKLVASVVLMVYPNIGKNYDDAEREKKALENATRYVNEHLGQVEPPSEYIEAGNGYYKKNPKFGRGEMPCRQAAKNEDVWQEIFGQWFDIQANPAQKELLLRMSTVSDREKWPSLRDYQGIHLDDYKVFLSWEDFKAAGQPKIVAEP